MAANTGNSAKPACVIVTQTLAKPIKVLKWKVREGNSMAVGRIVLLYQFADADAGSTREPQRKWKSAHAGVVRKVMPKEGSVIAPGESLLELEPCIHPTVMNDMCAECGTDLRKNDTATTASVPMVHTIPDLKVSEEQARILGKADNERLLKDRKLVLLVDLDQTLIHTTNDNIPANIKDVYHFQLYGSNSPWYHTRLRPKTHEFLFNVSANYELHICTFGARNYAHMIAMFLDSDQRYFSNRILSRDECFDPTSKKANLTSLFPCGDNLVCIIDDREDVWSHASNLIHVKPYHFFQHTGDINAPPGLSKQENDNQEGVDLTKIKDKVANNDSVKSESNTLEGNNENSEETNLPVKTDDSSIISTDDNKPDESKLEAIPESTDEAKEESEVPAENKNGIESEYGEKDEPSNSDSNTIQVDDFKSAAVDNKDSSSKDDDMIEVEDPDDYLLYLEDILQRIHKTFYDELDDASEKDDVPDLKQVIPRVRSQVLDGTRLVFSGLVPTHVALEQSRAYQVARGLGAAVTSELGPDTTHLVAVRVGTAKVNAGRRRKHLKIVTPDWLWGCAERWERIPEEIFPLDNKGSKNRHPPPHCSSPEHLPNYPTHKTPAQRKRTPSGRFMDTINPLMSFSSDDIANMDKEVEDILDDDSESSDGDDDGADKTKSGNHEQATLALLVNEGADDEDSLPPTHLPAIVADSRPQLFPATRSPPLGDNARPKKRRRNRKSTSPTAVTVDNDESSTSNSSSSAESLTAEYPRGFKRTRDQRERERLENALDESEQDAEDEDNEAMGVDGEPWMARGAEPSVPSLPVCNRTAADLIASATACDDSSLDEFPSSKFRRGEQLDSDLDIGQESNSEGSVEPTDDVEDGEWNMMGAALEREFLSNN